MEEAVVLATYKKGKDSRGNVQVHAQEQVWVAVDGEGVYGYGEGVDARSSRGQGRNWLVKPNVVFTAGAGPRQHPTTGQVWVAVDREGDKEGDGMRPLASNVLRAFQKDKTNDTAVRMVKKITISDTKAPRIDGQKDRRYRMPPPAGGSFGVGG